MSGADRHYKFNRARLSAPLTKDECLPDPTLVRPTRGSRLLPTTCPHHHTQQALRSQPSNNCCPPLRRHNLSLLLPHIFQSISHSRRPPSLPPDLAFSRVFTTPRHPHPHACSHTICISTPGLSPATTPPQTAAAAPIRPRHPTSTATTTSQRSVARGAHPVPEALVPATLPTCPQRELRHSSSSSSALFVGVLACRRFEQRDSSRAQAYGADWGAIELCARR